jgi:single-stranded-DNA-specific exonuclease
MRVIYRQRQIPDVDIGALCRQTSLERLTVKTLAARGITEAEEIKRFLDASEFRFYDPFLLNDMDISCRRIEKALEHGERIAVYADYDADGVCAAAILLECFRELGRDDIILYIPNRTDEGYGLNRDAVTMLAEKGVELIITVDCGVTSAEEVRHAKDLGMEIIVTDHHKCPEALPDCPVVSPRLKGYPFDGLCGAGVAYKLACALAKKTLRGRYVQLAGLATVADIVPLTDENRSIVKQALKEINENPAEGIAALMECAGIKPPCTSSDIAFYIAPRINAAGRMEDAYCCAELLTTRDAARAGEIAAHLNTLNAKRQELCNDIYESALEKLKALKPGQYLRSIILADPTWKHGVIGITASKLAERFNRPVILFEEKDGVLTGSARSIPGIDIMSAQNRVQTLLTRFGGHEQAAGITMPAACLDEFAGEINGFLAGLDEEVFIPVHEYDAQVCLADISVKLAEEISLLEPFGHKNPEPCYLVSGAKVEQFRYIGKDGSHLRLKINDGTDSADVTAFGKACWWQSIVNKDVLDAVVSLGTWNGHVALTARGISQINDRNMLINGISGNFFQIYNAFFAQSLYNIGQALSAKTLYIRTIWRI